MLIEIEMRNIKHILDTLKDQQKVIDDLIHRIQENWGNESEVLSLFLGSPEFCFIHPRVIELLADFLQCLNSESLFEEFDLLEVRNLYELNIKVIPEYLLPYESLYHFNDAVLGDMTSAREAALDGLSVASKYSERFDKFIQPI